MRLETFIKCVISNRFSESIVSEFVHLVLTDSMMNLKIFLAVKFLRNCVQNVGVLYIDR